jgi:hypothetical protein
MPCAVLHGLGKPRRSCLRKTQLKSLFFKNLKIVDEAGTEH